MEQTIAKYVNAFIDIILIQHNNNNSRCLSIYLYLPPFFKAGNSSSTNFRSVGSGEFTKCLATIYFFALTISRDCVESLRIESQLKFNFFPTTLSLDTEPWLSCTTLVKYWWYRDDSSRCTVLNAILVSIFIFVHTGTHPIHTKATAPELGLHSF